LEFLTRLYFANMIQPAKAGRIYLTQEHEISSAIRRLRLLLAHVPEDRAYDRLSLDLRLRQMELVRNWLQDVRARFHMKPGSEK
jgi:hypothetical protein